MVAGYEESQCEQVLYKPITTVVCVDTVLRFWRYDDFALDFMLAQQFNYEFEILEQAKANDMKHIVQLDETRLTSYAVLFNYRRYDMDLRAYLRKHRDYRKLPEILLQVVAGLKELRRLGYVHRDLKPENIVLNLKRPIEVAIIDFDRSLPAINTCLTGTRGTAGYEPDQSNWFDGSVMWDMYALVCIVVDCDMPIDEFMKASDSREAEGLIKKHVKKPDTCKLIYDLAQRVVLSYNNLDVPTYDELEEMIKQIKFRQYK